MGFGLGNGMYTPPSGPSCWFASHGGPVGGQEQKHFSPLGNELYFDANLAEKFLLY